MNPDHYSNMLDAQLDAAIAAMATLGYGEVKVVISETGWPTSGDSSGATVANAASYNTRLVSKLLSNTGTPRRPQTFFATFIFALFNEDEKTGHTTERNWGLFYPDGTPVYDIDLSAGVIKTSHTLEAASSSSVVSSTQQAQGVELFVRKQELEDMSEKCQKWQRTTIKLQIVIVRGFHVEVAGMTVHKMDEEEGKIWEIYNGFTYFKHCVHWWDGGKKEDNSVEEEEDVGFVSYSTLNAVVACIGQTFDGHEIDVTSVVKVEHHDVSIGINDGPYVEFGIS
ncbi:uncharacterized protein LOC131872593 [Cryptomeria japonica]|uniref:uncharacterized protein LOC131872593 n=1 Tax=Cryptomeria japonica TaxID=3369 RepID=UPI0027DA45A9|nr:uncharacterized protein LOC131872593 [Cryptomeria japonica]